MILPLAYVDVIGKVEPSISGEGGAPFFLSSNHPNEVDGF